MVTTHNGDKDRHFTIFTKSCTWSKCLLVHIMVKEQAILKFHKMQDSLLVTTWNGHVGFTKACLEGRQPQHDGSNLLHGLIPCIYSKIEVTSICKLVFFGFSDTTVYTHHWICMPLLGCMAPIIIAKNKFRWDSNCNSAHRPHNAQ